MSDFEYGQVEVRYNSADYGPFTFDFEDQAPTGAVISSVAVKSYSGNVDVGDPLSAETETTSLLVDAGKTGPSGDYTVDVYFNYPGISYEGNHTLFFEITWDNGATHPYTFYKVKVV